MCGKELSENEGGLISFALCESDREWKRRMEATGGKGHPPWMDWFCAEHYQKAQLLSDMDIASAMRQIKSGQ